MASFQSTSEDHTTQKIQSTEDLLVQIKDLQTQNKQYSLTIQALTEDKQKLVSELNATKTNNTALTQELAALKKELLSAKNSEEPMSELLSDIIKVCMSVLFAFLSVFANPNL